MGNNNINTDDEITINKVAEFIGFYVRNKKMLLPRFKEFMKILNKRIVNIVNKKN